MNDVAVRIDLAAEDGDDVHHLGVDGNPRLGIAGDDVPLEQDLEATAAGAEVTRGQPKVRST